MKKIPKHLQLPLIVGFAVFIISFVQYRELRISNADLRSVLEVKEGELARVQHENGELLDAVDNHLSTIGNLESQVDTLSRLQETDPELLKKYSKVYFLSDNYIPRGLVEIPAKYVLDEDKKPLILAKVYPKLDSLISSARAEGLDLYVASAFRSFEEQNSLKSTYKVIYGAGTANSFSADQGYSEHQLGTTLDFTTTKIGGGLSGFDKTPEYTWLRENAYKYGFVLSYPPNNSYYIFEPWHWRFVGVELATRLHDENQYFVELQQRQIDPYLISIFK